MYACFGRSTSKLSLHYILAFEGVWMVRQTLQFVPVWPKDDPF